MTGMLGEIIFRVNSEEILTPEGIVWTGSARHAEHRRHLTDALTEFTGLDPDRMSFNILLSEELGVTVMDELVKLWTYNRRATPIPLTIGPRPFGKYRWTVRNHRIRKKFHNAAGAIATAEVSINLLEYLRR